MSATHITLGAAADERKARLAKLKSLKRKQPEDETITPASNRSPSPPQSPNVAKIHLSGRNYDPEAKGPRLGFEAPPTVGLDKPTLEQQAKEVEDEIKKKVEEEEQDDKGVDLFKLQPKKPNWDLKRDLEEKLMVLDVRTDNAIASIVRERIENEKALKVKVGRGAVIDGDGDEEMGAMGGVELVEAMKQRDREREEEVQREQVDDEME